MNDYMYYARLIANATDPGNPAKRGTFKGWQMEAVTTRKTLKRAREDYDRDLCEIVETYSPAVGTQKKVELDAKYSAVVTAAREKLTEALDAVCESKRHQFDKSSGAPSEADLRLLQALSMRSSLTIAEVANTVGKLNGNVQSLGVLRDIAAKHNIRIPVGATTPEEFDTMLQRAKEFGLDRLRELDTPDRELSYRGKMFFDYADFPGEASHFFDPLDSNVLTSEQIAVATNQTGVDKATETEATETASGSEMWAEVTASNNLSLSVIAAQFRVSPQQIRDANPGKDLDRIYNGDRIIVPSTRFTFQPDPSGGHVQPGQVRAVPAPKREQKSDTGAEIGEDISVV